MCFGIIVSEGNLVLIAEGIACLHVGCTLDDGIGCGNHGIAAAPHAGNVTVGDGNQTIRELTETVTVADQSVELVHLYI